MKSFSAFLSALSRIGLVVLVLGCFWLLGRSWLADHPEHNPWAPLNLGDPPGWATGRKLAALRGDKALCTAFLERSAIPVDILPSAGSAQCLRDDRQVLSAGDGSAVSLSPSRPQTTCSVDAAFNWWLAHGIQPAAETIMGSRVTRIEHMGTYNCRRIGGGETGNWSEHATGNAIDISAFVFADGRRLSVLADWPGEGPGAAFLRAVRDSACTPFGTVLSPEYNAAHADHLHLDQAERTAGWSVCR